MNKRWRAILRGSAVGVTWLRHSPWWAAGLVAAMGMCGAVLAAYLSWHDTQLRAEARLVGAADRIVAALQRRLDQQLQILLAGGALLDSAASPGAVQWQRATQALQLPQRHPEIVQLSYIGADTLLLEAAPARRLALVRARDSGQPVLEAAAPAGAHTVVLYLPVYRGGVVPSALEERRRAWLGAVYSTLRADQIIDKVLERGYGALAVDVYAGARVDPAQLLYRAPQRSRHAPVRRSLHFGGAGWTLLCYPRHGAESDAARSLQVLAAGSVMTLLLSLLVYNLAATRNRAFLRASMINRDLIRSQNQLRAVLDSAADGILTVDRHGIVQSANCAAEHTFGVPAGALLGCRLDAKIAGLDGARLAALLGLESGRLHAARLEARGVRASGEQFPLALSVTAFALDGDHSFALIARDISDEKMAEAVLQLRLRAIEAANNGIVIADMQLPGQPVIYVNPAFTRITGYSEDEIVGRNCKLLLGDERQQPAVAQMAAAIAAGRSCEVLVRNYRKEGAAFWNQLSISPVRDSDGCVTHYVGSQCDVTERLRAEATLQVRTERLHAVFALSPDGLVVFGADGRLSDVNPAFQWMSGCGEAQLLGLTMAQFDTLLASLCDPARPYPPLGTDGASSMLHLMQPAPCILARSIRGQGDAGGEQVVYFRNVTHETEVDRIKSEFLSTAAHELRTPLASIYGFSELLLRRRYDEATQQELFGTIHRQAGVLINLINELLDLARIEARAGKDFHYRCQALGPVIEQTVASLLIHNDERKVSVQLPAVLPLVQIDAEKIGQALSNVLVNAYKYSPRGGAIELDVVEQAGRVGIRVRDYGLGLAPQHLARLFERFFRADPSGNIPGTGLGMCIVKEIMELHNGNVEVESTLGQGTTVTLYLPLAEAAALAA